MKPKLFEQIEKNTFRLNEAALSVEELIKKYIDETEYDIQNSLGNCSFFARDVINWGKRNGIKIDYVFMPQNKEYRKANNIDDEHWEDHIVPMYKNTIIDFAMTPDGVSKFKRKENTIPPKLSTYGKSLFDKNGLYGQYGYTNPEINTFYGNHKDINSFDVVAPKKK